MANLIIIFLIAILAFGASTGVSSVTNGDYLLKMFNITINETPKLAIVDEGNFTPMWINQIIIKVDNTNKTNITNATNTSVKNNTSNGGNGLNKSNS